MKDNSSQRLSSNSSDTYKYLNEVWGKKDDQTDEEYRQDISHWRHVGRWKDDRAWQRIGSNSRRVIEDIQKMTKTPHNWGETANILEWGPGGGANVFAFRNISRNYFGIDISNENLDEAHRMITEEGYNFFRPVLVKEPADALKKIDEKVDYFLSTAVFQHFPNNDYGIEVLQVIAQLCNKDALGVIQIRFDNGTDKYKGISDISEYKDKHIVANSYRIDQFNDICNSAGFEVVGIRDINTKVQYVTYLLKYKGQ